MPPDEQDRVTEIGDWVDPFSDQLGWTANRTALAVVGATVRPKEDYPCQEPHPCIDPDGRTFTPGRLVPITLHKARGRDLIGQPGTINQELCRHHYGVYMVNERGRMVPVMFSAPNSLEAVVYASVGYFTIGDGTDRPDDDLLSLCRPGRACGVVALELPETIEGVFDSEPKYCGGVQ